MKQASIKDVAALRQKERTGFQNLKWVAEVRENHLLKNVAFNKMTESITVTIW